jgi:hypothetical protein
MYNLKLNNAKLFKIRVIAEMAFHLVRPPRENDNFKQRPLAGTGNRCGHHYLNRHLVSQIIITNDHANQITRSSQAAHLRGN